MRACSSVCKLTLIILSATAWFFLRSVPEVWNFASVSRLLSPTSASSTIPFRISGGKFWSSPPNPVLMGFSLCSCSRGLVEPGAPVQRLVGDGHVDDTPVLGAVLTADQPRLL